MAGKKTSNRTSTKKVNTKSKNYGLTQNRGKGGKSGRNDAYIENRKKLKEEIAAVILITVGVFFLISLSWNFTGNLGKNIALLLKGCFSICAYVLPILLILYGIMIFTGHTKPIGIKTIILLMIVFTSINLISAGQFLDYGGVRGYFSQIYANSQRLESGGVLGMYMGAAIIGLVGKIGLYLFSIVILVISIMLIINKPFSKAYKEAVEKKNVMSEKRREKQDEKLSDDYRNGYRQKHEDPLDDYRNRIEDKKKKKSIINLMKNDENYGVMPNDMSKQLSMGFESSREGKYAVHGTGDEQKIDKNMFSSTGQSLSLGYNPYDGNQNNFPGESDSKFSKTVNDMDVEFISSENNGHTSKECDDVKGSTPRCEKSENNDLEKYKKPPLSLLITPNKTNRASRGSNSLRTNAMLLEETLKSFNVDAKVINVTKGSSVTKYEIQPAIGVKVASIVRLADDIALNLRARSIRIEAPIPGKAAVGIEIENETREMVTIKEILSSNQFKSHDSNLAFAVGKDIGGLPVIADLAKMPHMLIAGATGSGKSVCINTIIASLLYKATPDEVRLILIDPKMVELGNYNGIPHLLIPVVTDSNKAAAALNWAVSEMTQRYKKFASKNVKDLKSYNRLMTKNGDGDMIMPKIVIIIDELADLMMVASSQVEDAIARLAQLARAAGMHLIVATQRPSVDVVTGIIKANIPSRIAFMVSSQIDSRTILDMAGAEKLVGNGDMLYKPQDTDKPIRVQGPYISDEEVHKIIEFVKNQGLSENYDNDVVTQVDKCNVLKGDNQGDELLDDAIRMVLQAGQASASMLQRRFRIGYNRAARMIDTMEALGIIGQQEGSKPRNVTMSLEEYESSLSKNDESEKI